MVATHSPNARGTTRRKRRIDRLAGAVVGALVVSAIGATAYASFVSPTGGYTACVTKTDPGKGAVRMIDVAGGESCTANEAQVQWSHGINFRGPWNGSTAYAVGDAVSDAGSSYVAKTKSTGVAPHSDARNKRWLVLALQGSTGAQGAQGAAGPQGVDGPQGPSGTDGAQGAEGPQGAQGAQGAQGIQGPRGFPGLPGIGLDGPQGPRGPSDLYYYADDSTYPQTKNVAYEAIRLQHLPAGNYAVTASLRFYDPWVLDGLNMHCELNSDTQVQIDSRETYVGPHGSGSVTLQWAGTATGNLVVRCNGDVNHDSSMAKIMAVRTDTITLTS